MLPFFELIIKPTTPFGTSSLAQLWSSHDSCTATDTATMRKMETSDVCQYYSEIIVTWIGAAMGYHRVEAANLWQ